MCKQTQPPGLKESGFSLTPAFYPSKALGSSQATGSKKVWSTSRTRLLELVAMWLHVSREADLHGVVASQRFIH